MRGRDSRVSPRSATPRPFIVLRTLQVAASCARSSPKDGSHPVPYVCAQDELAPFLHLAFRSLSIVAIALLWDHAPAGVDPGGCAFSPLSSRCPRAHTVAPEPEGSSAALGVLGRPRERMTQTRSGLAPGVSMKTPCPEAHG